MTVIDAGKLELFFDQLRDACATFCGPSEHLAVGEAFVLFKGRVVLKQYISKEHKDFGINIYKLCNMTGYTYHMRIYLGKDRQNATQMVTATYATVESD